MAERADLLLRGGRLVPGDRLADVAVAGGTIVAVDRDLTVDTATTIEVDGHLVAPGFIDVQVNGGYGWDLTERPEGMWTLGERLRPHGITAFLPTIVSTDLETVDHAREVVTAGPPAGYHGATVLGLHVEGPFLSPDRRGAHDPARLRAPAPDLVAGWEDAVRLVTLAPELPGAAETIHALVERGIVVSAGHSDATFDQAIDGFDRGIRMVTHLFNAMSGVEHRRPGLAAAALADHRVTVGLILDLVHVHRGAVLAAWPALADRLALVTDMAAVAGSDTPTGRLGGRRVTTSVDGAPRLASGELAGSVLTMDTAVRNHVATIGAGVDRAVAAATRVPGRLLGLERSVTVGAPADLTVLDGSLQVAATVVAGHPEGARV